jgi:hypothetical protein
VRSGARLERSWHHRSYISGVNNVAVGIFWKRSVNVSYPSCFDEHSRVSSSRRPWSSPGSLVLLGTASKPKAWYSFPNHDGIKVFFDLVRLTYDSNSARLSCRKGISLVSRFKIPPFLPCGSRRRSIHIWHLISSILKGTGTTNLLKMSNTLKVNLMSWENMLYSTMTQFE